jgi:quercetin dioxygenase-like cupin family protein
MVSNQHHYMTNIAEVPPKGVSADQGWVGMDIRFPLPPDVARRGGVALFRAVFRPGAQHRAHVHPNADEFFYVVRGRAAIGAGDEEHEVGAGTVDFVPRGTVHWLRNLDAQGEVEVVGGYLGVGTLEEAGYELT